MKAKWQKCCSRV